MGTGADASQNVNLRALRNGEPLELHFPSYAKPVRARHVSTDPVSGFVVALSSSSDHQHLFLARPFLVSRPSSSPSCSSISASHPPAQLPAAYSPDPIIQGPSAEEIATALRARGLAAALSSTGESVQVANGVARIETPFRVRDAVSANATVLVRLQALLSDIGCNP